MSDLKFLCITKKLKEVLYMSHTFGSFEDYYEKLPLTINDTLVHWDEIRETFLQIVGLKEMDYNQVVNYFNVESDTFADFLELLSERFEWFDYRMAPHIIEFLSVLIEDEFDDFWDDDDSCDEYDMWYEDLEDEVRDIHNIELVDLLERVRYRINVEHFFEKGKSPEQAVFLIGMYYRDEIEELQKRMY